jgi:hypothetical protein
MERADPRGELRARHRSGHLMVGENEVGLLPVRDEIPSFAGRCRLDNASTEKTQFLGDNVADEGLIFDNKNPNLR